MTTTDLVKAIESWQLPCGSEAALQLALEQLFSGLGLEFTREHVLSPIDRLDFFVAGVAVEAKIKGSLTDLMRQLHRYAQHESVRELLVVTPAIRLSRLPRELNGKPVSVALLLGGL